MAAYLTRQRRLLLDHLAQHPDEALSALQIAAALRDRGISTSAVYRNLAALEQAQLLQKLGVNAAGEQCYRYLGTESCRKSLHFSCVKCRKTVHLTESTTAGLLSLLENEGCTLSNTQTILYGTCRDCR